MPHRGGPGTAANGRPGEGGRALVTVAGAGSGRAIVLRLLRAGHRVIALDRDADALEKLEGGASVSRHPFDLDDAAGTPATVPPPAEAYDGRCRRCARQGPRLHRQFEDAALLMGGCKALPLLLDPRSTDDEAVLPSDSSEVIRSSRCTNTMRYQDHGIQIA